MRGGGLWGRGVGMGLGGGQGMAGPSVGLGWRRASRECFINI